MPICPKCGKDISRKKWKRHKMQKRCVPNPLREKMREFKDKGKRK